MSDRLRKANVAEYNLSLPERTMTFIGTSRQHREAVDNHPRLTHHNSIPTKNMARYQADLAIGMRSRVHINNRPKFSSASSWRCEEDRAKVIDSNQGKSPTPSTNQGLNPSPSTNQGLSPSPSTNKGISPTADTSMGIGPTTSTEDSFYKMHRNSKLTGLHK